MNPWKLLKEKKERRRFFTILIRTFREETGKKVDYEIVEQHSGSGVLGITPEGKLVVVREFRPAIMKCAYGISGGTGNNGESSPATARREFLEETGFHCTKLTHLLNVYGDAARSTHIDHLYFAHAVRKTARHLDGEERLNVVLVTPAQLEKIMRTEIVHDTLAVAYFAAKAKGLVK
jgi:ADP-ribose pyrophosphatase